MPSRRGSRCEALPRESLGKRGSLDGQLEGVVFLSAPGVEQTLQRNTAIAFRVIKGAL